MRIFLRLIGYGLLLLTGACLVRARDTFYSTSTSEDWFGWFATAAVGGTIAILCLHWHSILPRDVCPECGVASPASRTHGFPVVHSSNEAFDPSEQSPRSV